MAHIKSLISLILTLILFLPSVLAVSDFSDYVTSGWVPLALGLTFLLFLIYPFVGSEEGAAASEFPSFSFILWILAFVGYIRGAWLPLPTIINQSLFAAIYILDRVFSTFFGLGFRDLGTPTTDLPTDAIDAGVDIINIGAGLGGAEIFFLKFLSIVITYRILVIMLSFSGILSGRSIEFIALSITLLNAKDLIGGFSAGNIMYVILKFIYWLFVPPSFTGIAFASMDGFVLYSMYLAKLTIFLGGLNMLAHAFVLDYEFSVYEMFRQGLPDQSGSG